MRWMVLVVMYGFLGALWAAWMMFVWIFWRTIGRRCSRQDDSSGFLLSFRPTSPDSATAADGATSRLSGYRPRACLARVLGAGNVFQLRSTISPAQGACKGRSFQTRPRAAQVLAGSGR